MQEVDQFGERPGGGEFALAAFMEGSGKVHIPNAIPADHIQPGFTLWMVCRGSAETQIRKERKISSNRGRPLLPAPSVSGFRPPGGPMRILSTPFCRQRATSFGQGLFDGPNTPERFRESRQSSAVDHPESPRRENCGSRGTRAWRSRLRNKGRMGRGQSRWSLRVTLISWSLYLDLLAAKLSFPAPVRHLFPILPRCVSGAGVAELYRYISEINRQNVTGAGYCKKSTRLGGENHGARPSGSRGPR